MTVSVNLDDAATRLGDLIHQAIQGEDVLTDPVTLTFGVVSNSS